ncbi:DNA polymerase delta subunit 4 [Podospora fimiseda]|uniref:DNA polymerase delta subunit 4 n=1 Tax=Podospora fimiseda TaxID=252190 RepID=A0AAN7BSU7_9PEZI|nr:DNA polymerase delta subunit 4 [Podospora fimiseda]
MAPRRSTRAATAAASAAGKPQQQKISFKNRVTKSIKEEQEGKKKVYKSPARAKEWKPVDVTSDSETSVKVEVEQLSLAPAVPVSEEEQQAKKITEAAIKKYWKGIEDSRGAKEVHRKHGEGLEVGEKVLRYFDVSSQYGPCVGIARIKRWHRANKLGLKPPIEVLAVLVKEGEDGLTKKGWERAHMDELLSSTAVGSV